MILVVEDLLSAEDIEYLRALYDELPAQEGAATADGALKEAKQNRQLALGQRAGEVRARLLDAMNRHPWLGYALLPKTVSVPLLNVYEEGMFYGNHTDAHLGRMGERFFRCDLSCTIFLDDPGSYDGGELCLRVEGEEAAYKLDAGGGVFYPTTYVHRVDEITRGRRRACVMWFESFVRDPARRAMLFELQKLRGWIESNAPVDSEPRQTVVNLCENLHRMWVDP